MKNKDVDRAKELTVELTQEDKEKIEKDVMDIVGENFDDTQPVILDIESIRVLKPGQYELDLVDLFKGEPLVYKLEDGKYVVDLLGTFEILKNKKKEESS
jgi:predicted  nucleic acid-binding Zn-ribbon protein